MCRRGRPARLRWTARRRARPATDRRRAPRRPRRSCRARQRPDRSDRCGRAGRAANRRPPAPPEPPRMPWRQAAGTQGSGCRQPVGDHGRDVREIRDQPSRGSAIRQRPPTRQVRRRTGRRRGRPRTPPSPAGAVRPLRSRRRSPGCSGSGSGQGRARAGPAGSPHRRRAADRIRRRASVKRAVRAAGPASQARVGSAGLFCARTSTRTASASRASRTVASGSPARRASRSKVATASRTSPARRRASGRPSLPARRASSISGWASRGSGSTGGSAGPPKPSPRTTVFGAEPLRGPSRATACLRRPTCAASLRRLRSASNPRGRSRRPSTSPRR